MAEPACWIFESTMKYPWRSNWNGSDALASLSDGARYEMIVDLLFGLRSRRESPDSPPGCGDRNSRSYKCTSALYALFAHTQWIVPFTFTPSAPGVPDFVSGK